MVQSVKFLLPKLDNLSLSHRPHGDELRLIIPALGSTGRQSLEPADQQTILMGVGRGSRPVVIISQKWGAFF